MSIIAKWNEHKFEISPTVFRSFSNMQVKGSCETEEKTGNGQKFVARKNTKPTEVTLTAHLNAYFGCNVRPEAMAWVQEARDGKSDYIYAHYRNNTAKMLPYKMMLTDASVTKIEIAANGVWLGADVALTFKTGSQAGGSTAGSSSSSGGGGGGYGGGYSKASTKNTSPTTTKNAELRTNGKYRDLYPNSGPQVLTGAGLTPGFLGTNFTQTRDEIVGANRSIAKSTASAKKAPTARRQQASRAKLASERGAGGLL